MEEKPTTVEPTQVLRNEWRIRVLELLVEHIINNNPTLDTPDQDQLQSLQERAVKELAEKYPGAGIEFASKQEEG